MKEKIILQLKAKLETLGVKNLSQARIDALADKLSSKITDESEIDAKLDELNDLHPFAELAKYDDWQRSKQTKKTEQQQQQQTTTTQTQSTSDDKPDLEAQFAELKKELDAFKKGQQTATIKEKVKAHDKLKDIPSTFWEERVLPEKEEDIDAFATKVEEGYTRLKQDLVNKGFAQSSVPAGSRGPVGNKPTDKELDEILDKI